MADLPSDGRRVDGHEMTGALQHSAARIAKQRRRGGDRSTQSAEERLAAADERDATASARDRAAVVRDEVAAQRHLKVVESVAASGQDDARAMSASEWIIRAAGHRKRAERIRAEAAEQARLAEQDRRVAAQDREQAACERLHALVDRELLADALASAEVDPLTGARTRAAGLTDLDRELLCSHRTGRALVVAYVDVVGLKRLNDTEGHGAGDALLVRVVALISEHLRAYDLIIRLGGDEFLCAMSAMTLSGARERFIQVAAELAAAPGAGAIRTGFAELEPHDTTSGLIARADDELLANTDAGDQKRSAPDPATATAEG